MTRAIVAAIGSSFLYTEAQFFSRQLSFVNTDGYRGGR